jgi:hypothetical protein
MTDNQDETAIVDVLDQFEQGIREKNHDVLLGVFLNDNAALYGVRDGVHPGGFNPNSNTAKGFADYITGSQATMEEHLIDPKVEIFEGIATAVCTYEFFSDGVMSNYGVDIFSLVKTEKGWKIASIVWSVTVTEEMLRRIEADPSILQK